jgi:hypothetical protein
MIRVGRERYSTVLRSAQDQLGERLADGEGSHLLRITGIFWMDAPPGMSLILHDRRVYSHKLTLRRWDSCAANAFSLYQRL